MMSKSDQSGQKMVKNRGVKKEVKKWSFFVFFMISMCVDDVIKLMLMMWCFNDVYKFDYYLESFLFLKSSWWYECKKEVKKTDPFWGQKKNPKS